MDFDMVAKMKVEELKSYLRPRGLKVSGRKEEQVARVFAAAENDVKPIKTAEEIEQEMQDDEVKLFTLADVAEALKEVETPFILSTAVPKPKINAIEDVIVSLAPKPDNIAVFIEPLEGKIAKYT
eukprot:gene6578-12114_t